MHPIQQKILKLTESREIGKMTLREIGDLVGEPDSPQKIKHHINQLAKKGLIRVDARKKKIERISVGLNKDTKLVSIPILGSANCGQALCAAEECLEGYLKISKTLLGDKLLKKAKHLFALKAVGPSMNRAEIGGYTIEDGDYVVIDESYREPSDGDYVLSVIEGGANLKKFHKKGEQVVLVSESTEDIPPIYIHENDFDDYMVNGKIVLVLKQPDELASFRDAAARDVLKDLGPMSKEEYEYYENL